MDLWTGGSESRQAVSQSIPKMRWRQAVRCCILHDSIHLAADAGVMDDGHRTGARRDQPLQVAFVKVERLRPDVDEHRSGAAQDEGVGSRVEGEGQDGYLVARPGVEQEERV